MNNTAIIVTVLMVLFVLFKIYNGYKTISTKGIKGLVTQKLGMLVVVGSVIGIFMLINPDFEMQNPKELITEYISTVVE